MCLCQYKLVNVSATILCVLVYINLVQLRLEEISGNFKYTETTRMRVPKVAMIDISTFKMSCWRLSVYPPSSGVLSQSGQHWRRATLEYAPPLALH